MGSMFIDHLAVSVIYNNGLDEISPFLEYIGLAMRLVGRMAFPLYAFLLVQGFMWTRDWNKYGLRVAMFALISEIPYDLMSEGELWQPDAQNTMVTLLIGLICMRMFSYVEQKYVLASKDVGERFIGLSIVLLTLAVGLVIVEFVNADYGGFGLTLIMIFYLFRHRPAEQMLVSSLLLMLMYNFGMYALAAWIAIFFISRYNGERGRKLGLTPYVFYPAHLLVAALIGAVIGKLL